MVNFKGAAFAAIAVLTSVCYALNTTLPAPVLVNLDTMGSGPSETVVGGLYRPNKIGPRAGNNISHHIYIHMEYIYRYR